MQSSFKGADLQGRGSAVASQSLAIVTFENEMFGSIRTAGTADEPFFCLADVCNALGLSAKGVNQRLTKEVISNYPLVTAGGVQNALFVNEDGLYDVILDSRKPEAKAFRKWITSEVLPQIRKTGGYIKLDAGDDDLTVMAKALKIMQRTLEQKDKLLEAKSATIGRQEDQIRVLAPKAAVYDKIVLAEGTYTATQLAKEFGYSDARAFYKKLMEQKILFRQSNTYMPFKDWADKGLFSYRTRSIKHSDGTVEVKTYLVFTEKFRMMVLRSRCRRAMNNL